ncbi:unnamed protein product [Strongylus vulgaris]|uniref:NUP210 C-terminal Ig-like domain-containing protein n=1 Tax=Strongylus vulgaris TaxID=40348 RepID=A0A3P7LKY9_STRVU|nr:unnamed protein product [Strongylus vulgaris]
MIEGSYACVIERQEAGQVHVDIVGATPQELKVIAKWKEDSQVRDAVTTTTFHMAMKALDSEVQLSDMDQKSAVLSIQVPSYHYRYVNVNGCPGDIVTVTETRHPSGTSSTANKFFLIKLNVKSAALWSELSEKCTVIVENGITGQKIYVPVRVRIVGQAKQVYNGQYLIQYDLLLEHLNKFCFST